jgi:lipopolysaccharide transport system ATP-binding protein
MSVVISVENVSKQYRLGEVGTGTLSHDVNRWWHKVRGKEDPYLKIGESNDRSKKGDSDYSWALRDVSFEVKQGEVLGIIGRNGAGKSTLLKILSRVTTPTTGEIKVKGRIASLLEVGTGFHPELTGRENIFLNGAILGMRKHEITRKLDEIIDFSGCERYIDTPVKRYSSGMYVRLAFAVAAHLEPEILIVDEVLAVGDAEFQKKCLGKMKDVAGEGRTVLFVSHNMAAIEILCTTAILFHSGKLVKEGPPSATIITYLSQGFALSVKPENGSLSNRPIKEIQIQDISFKSLEVTSSCLIHSREFLEATITISSKRILHDVVIGLNINDNSGVRVATLWSGFNSQRFDLKAGLNRFHLSLDSLPLIPGNYGVDVTVGLDGQGLDSAEDLAVIEVLAPRLSQNTRQPQIREHGYLMPEFNWRVASCPKPIR